jgi:TRAP-type mannitol/chloroaromatic compound transport system permease large subunit
MAPAIFYLRGTSPPQVSLKAMHRGVVPFIVLDLMMLGACTTLSYFFPALARWLPEVVFKTF